MDHRWIQNQGQSQKNNQNAKGAAAQVDKIDGENEIMDLKVNLKELLNVSSGWKDVNNLRGDNPAGENGPINKEFQAKQMDRIVEAIAMTLPAGANTSMHGLSGMHGGNTLSTANLDS